MRTSIELVLPCDLAGNIDMSVFDALRHLTVSVLFHFSKRDLRLLSPPSSRVTDAIEISQNYLYEAHTSGKHHLADLYELVQYAGESAKRAGQGLCAVSTDGWKSEEWAEKRESMSSETAGLMQIPFGSAKAVLRSRVGKVMVMWMASMFWREKVT
jgi:hypothetical protein